MKSVCICQANYIGEFCQTQISSLSLVNQAKLGCAIRPCNAGSTCEDKADGTFVCHCPVVIKIF